MTVEITTSKVTYDGDDLVVEFPVNFTFLEDDDLTVQLTDADDAITTWVRDVDYTLDGAGVDGGGTLTATVAPATGETLTITRNTDLTQERTFAAQGSFPAASHEAALDKLTLLIQELYRRIVALEAGAVTSTYTAARVTDTFTVAEPAEDTWPRTVAAGAAPATVVIGRIENLTTPAEILDTPPSLQWAPSGTDISVKRIDGLTPGQEYRITFEVRT